MIDVLRSGTPRGLFALRRPAALAAATLAVAVLAGAALGDNGSWRELTGAVVPPPLEAPAYALDAGRNQLLLFGGRNEYVEADTVWTLDLGPDTWTAFRATGVWPSARAGAAMAFDDAGDRAVLFGGGRVDELRNETEYFGDTWLMARSSGAPRWTELPYAPGGPSARAGASLVYQPRAGAAGRVILYGGYDGVQPHGDLWSLDLGAAPLAWARLDVDCPAGPPGRDGHVAVFDAGGKRMLVLGGWRREVSGAVLDDLWAFDLSSGSGCWQQLQPGGSPPPGLAEASVATDGCAAAPQMVVFGGLKSVNTGGVTSLADSADVWTLALEAGSAAWTRSSPAGVWPPARHAHASAFDPAGRRTVVFGGATTAGALLDDTWALAAAPCSGPTPTANATATALAATRTAMAPTPTATLTPDELATFVAGTLTAMVPTTPAPPSATLTPDALGTAIAATLTAVSPAGHLVFLPAARTGRTPPE